MHPILTLPELLRHIFHALTFRSDILSCALVCRLWSPWALEELELTREVTLGDLMSVLNIAVGEETAESVPEEVATAFRKRCRQVGNIIANWRELDTLEKRLSLVRSVLGLAAEGSCSTGSQNHFPYLHTLAVTAPRTIDAEPAFMVLLSRSLTHLTMYTTTWGRPDDMPATVIDSVAPHVPNLTSLIIDGYSYSHGPNLSLFKQLTKLRLINCYMNLETWESLAGLPELKHLWFGRSELWLWVNMDVEQADWNGLEGRKQQTFPSLKTIGFQGNPSNAFISLVIFRSTMPALETITMPNTKLREWSVGEGGLTDIIKHFRVHGRRFEGFLDGDCTEPAEPAEPSRYYGWSKK